MSNKRYNQMKQKIAESKKIAKKQLKAMRYNSKPLQISCSTPPSNITWGTYR